MPDSVPGKQSITLQLHTILCALNIFNDTSPYAHCTECLYHLSHTWLTCTTWLRASQHLWSRRDFYWYAKFTGCLILAEKRQQSIMLKIMVCFCFRTWAIETKDLWCFNLLWPATKKICFEESRFEKKTRPTSLLLLIFALSKQQYTAFCASLAKGAENMVTDLSSVPEELFVSYNTFRPLRWLSPWELLIVAFSSTNNSKHTHFTHCVCTVKHSHFPSKHIWTFWLDKIISFSLSTENTNFDK